MNLRVNFLGRRAHVVDLHWIRDKTELAVITELSHKLVYDVFPSPPPKIDTANFKYYYTAL